MSFWNLGPRWIAIIHDIVMASVSFVLTYDVLLNNMFVFRHGHVLSLVFFTAISGAVFTAMRLYKGLWRYASLQDLLAIFKAATLVVALFFLYALLSGSRLDNASKGLVVSWLLLIILLGGPRFFYRILKDKILYPLWQDAEKKTPVILVGLNDNADLFLREISRRSGFNYCVVGIVDPRPAFMGRTIQKTKIMGGYAVIPTIIHEAKIKGLLPQKLVVSDPRLDKNELQDLLALAQSYGMTLAKLPDLSKLQDPLQDESIIRPIALEDLLGRPQVVLDYSAVEMLIKDQRVLITGAGGTIGTELVMQITQYKPSLLILIDNSEYNLYAIEQAVKNAFPYQAVKALLADVRMLETIESIFEEHSLDLVFHAAALKHVPMLENNIEQAILTNVIGTKHVADCCSRYGVSKMVMISTDKAVNPLSVMGASKRLAEDYCQTVGFLAENKTSFSTVRFGNVLGSSGSVIPLFQQQLSKGGPLTVTDPHVTRYFMTVHEAVALILQAASIPANDESHAAIYVLDMGNPIKIDDLAKQVIRLAGLEPMKDVKVEYIGLRPGEKMTEELFDKDESPISTNKPGVLLAAARKLSYNGINHHVLELKTAALSGDRGRIMDIIRQSIAGF